MKNEKSNPITAIVIGAGARGWTYANYALDNPDKLKIVGVAEPIESVRNEFAKVHNIPAKSIFITWEDVFNCDKLADTVLICTQDNMHYGPAMAAIEKGYDILLEKPISPIPEECIEIANGAKVNGVKVIVCHVLRYTPFFSKIKSIIDKGEIGDIVSMVHNENVGYMHHAHSFVRGNWRKAGESSPMILAKSCHDVDIIQWLIGKKCLKVSSFGSLTYFNLDNCPKDAPARCTDGCRHDCPFDARKWYLLGGPNENIAKSWFAPIATQTLNPTNEQIEHALKTGPYGRCVFQCDNDVVDHQVVNMEFEGGVTVAFSMCSFTHDINRTLRIMGTKGEIRGNMNEDIVIVYDFLNNTKKQVSIEHIEGHVGHGGGDTGIMESFCEYIRGDYKGNALSEIGISADNHMISFAAEESRIKGGKVIHC